MSLPKNDNARGQAGEVGKATASDAAFSRGAQPRVNILPFCRPRRACCGCGQPLAGEHVGDACVRCHAWDLLIRAMSLRRQALGMLARAGGW